MNKNILRIAIIAGIIVAAIALRWGAGFILSNKNPLKPILPQAPAAKESVVLREAKSMLEEGNRAGAVNSLDKVISDSEGSKDAYEALLLLAEIYEQDNNFTKAKGIYRSILSNYSDYCDYSDIQKRLTSLNMAILFSKTPTPESEIYTIVPGDTLSKIAKKYSTTVDLIKKANGLDSDLIIPGMQVKVQNTPFTVIVDKSQSTLTLLLGDEVMKVYIVSTGKNNSTPVGTFQIKDKLIDPVWYSNGAIVSPDSPENVLGTRWMGLNTPVPGYGIHGTIEPESIGYQCTEGCVRLKNEEVEELFTITPVGTQVTIID